METISFQRVMILIVEPRRDRYARK